MALRLEASRGTDEGPDFFTTCLYVLINVTKYYVTGLIVGYFLYMTVTTYTHTWLWNLHLVPPLIDEAEQSNGIFDESAEISEYRQEAPTSRSKSLEKGRKKRHRITRFEDERYSQSNGEQSRGVDPKPLSTSRRCLKVERSEIKPEQSPSNLTRLRCRRRSNSDHHLPHSYSNSDFNENFVHPNPGTNIPEQNSPKLTRRNAKKEEVPSKKDIQTKSNEVQVPAISRCDKKVCTTDLNTDLMQFEDTNAHKEHHEKQTSTVSLLTTSVETVDKNLSTIDIKSLPSLDETENIQSEVLERESFKSCRCSRNKNVNMRRLEMEETFYPERIDLETVERSNFSDRNDKKNTRRKSPEKKISPDRNDTENTRRKSPEKKISPDRNDTENTRRKSPEKKISPDRNDTENTRRKSPENRISPETSKPKNVGHAVFSKDTCCSPSNEKSLASKRDVHEQ